MASSLVVLRTSVLLMFLLAVVTGLYASHVTRLSADAASQAAAAAAARAAAEVGWQCQAPLRSEVKTAATRAALSQIEHLAVQPVAIEVSADACNLIVAVSAAPLDTRLGALTATATACRSVGRSAALSITGSC
ncbi:hypothetical protein [Candidatus Poriferisocius sp.]|uniref:hypothetical protein n=1 Tax=Candidatus Poriferisocius sp. TaxID=3101276 RepID=UPI003B025159